MDDRQAQQIITLLTQKTKDGEIIWRDSNHGLGDHSFHYYATFDGIYLDFLCRNDLLGYCDEPIVLTGSTKAGEFQISNYGLLLFLVREIPREEKHRQDLISSKVEKEENARRSIIMALEILSKKGR